jgi:membrane associated rhomboid family serine protease
MVEATAGAGSEAGTVVHRTREGQQFTVDAARYAAMKRLAFPQPGRRNRVGALTPLVLALLLVAVQFLAASGFPPSDAAIAGFGLDADWMGEALWKPFSCLFIHRTPTQMALNLGAILVFGATLGWRACWVTVLTIFLAGGAAGALAGLGGAVAAGQAAFVGADGSALALMAASTLFAPRLVAKDGWIPWNLLLAYAFLAAYVANSCSQGGCGPVPPFFHMFLSGLTGIGVGLVMVEAEQRNDYRFASIFLVVGMWFFLRTMGLVRGMAVGEVPLSSVTTWLKLALDLFLLFVGTIYVMIQAEVVRDKTRFAQEEHLDLLVEQSQK